MTDASTAPPRPPRRILRRIAAGIGVLGLVATLAAYLFLPALARPLLERGLSAALHTPVSIGQLAWEPLDGRLTARDIALGAAEERISAARLFVEGSPRALWRGEIVVDRLEIDAPVGALQLDAQYRPILPGFGDAAAAGSVLPPIALRQLEVTDGELTVRYPVQHQLRAAQLHIARLVSSDITVREGAVEMAARLDGALDGAPLQVAARLHLAGDDSVIQATGALSGLEVNRRTIDLLPELATFHATVDVRATYTAASAPARHTLQLDATLHEPRITDDAGTEFAAQTVLLPDVLVDLAQGSIAIDQVTIDQPVGAIQLDAQYRPTLASFGGGSSSAATGADTSSPSVTVKALVVTDGELTIRYPVRGQLRTAPLHIERLACADVEAAAGRLRLDAQLNGVFDGAPVQGTAHLQLGGATPSIAVTLGLSGFALDRERIDLPDGLETLRTTLDAHATYESQTTPSRQALQLATRLISPRLSGADGTELAAKTIALPGIVIDLLEQRVDLGTITLESPSLSAVLTTDGLLLPRPAGSGAGGSAWAVQSGAIDVRGARVQLRRGDSRLALAIASARWGGLVPGHPQALSLRASADGGGSLAVSGDLGLDPLDAALEVKIHALPLPLLAELTEMLPVRLATGSGDATLRVAQRDGRTRLHGEVHLQNAHSAPPDPRRPSEVLAVNRADAELTFDSAAAPPLDIARLRLDYPYVMVQRRRDGLFPADLLDADAAPRAANGAPARAAQVRIRQLELAGGKVEFIDTTVQPAFWTSLSNMTARAEELALPAATSGSFTIGGKRDEISAVEVAGRLTPKGLEARATLRDALLASLNPYVSPLLGYDVTAGWLALQVDAAPAPPLYQATARMVLRGIDVLQTGVDAIQQQSGVPLPIALGLIADSAGQIDMTLPLALDPASGRVTLGSVVGQAVRGAILGALTSPLRILGSLFGTKGAPHAFAIDPIPFAPGAGGLDAAGTARVAEIARILQAHPTLILVASPQIATADLAALADTDPRSLADARSAAIRTAFTGAAADPRLPPERLLLVEWNAPAGPLPSDPPGVYVELQDQP